ncbi:MAG: DUF4252 domain-containing protein [Cyclobacteriaceae bacterium]|jgi:hypothetical protein|nr:hypothetical protein [Cytophagales bacterium]HNP78260.1 DUF4252 domain-containing protein [Cyclobacteriaceae bacterium]HQQ84054.1 DUF4252 domain-containing protein [Cyclobacteriaceae bacterium]
MKKILILMTLVVFSQATFAQSRSFEKLREKFHGAADVHTLKIGGIFLRVVMKLATSDDLEAREMLRSVNQVRLMVIPQEAFERQGLSVDGFRSVLRKDAFDEMTEVRNGKDRVTVYMRPDSNQSNRYFVLVANDEEVVAMEMKGNVDTEWLAKNNFVKAGAR